MVDLRIDIRTKEMLNIISSFNSVITRHLEGFILLIGLPIVIILAFFCVDASCPSQHFFSHIWTFSCLSGLYHYKAKDCTGSTLE